MGRFALALALGTVVLLVSGGLAAAFLGAAPAADASGSTSTGATATALPTTTVTSTASEVLAISGHGWGHGLGMSQWGAYGYAKHGWTYDRILAHYYLGTTLGAAKAKTVRVLVAQGSRTTIASTVGWTVTDATGAKTALAPGSLSLTAKLRVTAAAKAQAPLTFSSAQPLTVDGRPYAGKLVLFADGKSVDVVNVVGLEQYVKGVVPMEMPSGWSAEALKAQAVAARSYALANVSKGKPFDLYGDTRSQVYGGILAQVPSSDAAVDATKGQVLLYGGKVADTLFFSTSGGRTASALESTGVAVPYLVPVADPYDNLSPYHDWGPVLLDASKVAAQLKLTGSIADISVVDGASGRVTSVAVTTDRGEDMVLSGNAARADFDLNSTWFTPSLLELLPAAKTMTYGGAAALSGLLRGADGVTLESKPYGTAVWAPGSAIVPELSGAYATIVKPQVTTWYRLAWGNARVGLARIAVAARVAAAATAAGVSGTVRPVAAGAPVQLQEQQPDGSWQSVSSTVTDSASAWSFAGSLASGTYRVRAAPGHGVVAGLSAPFAVQ